MNAALEFHDSTTVAVERSAAAIVVRLHAYVHRSAGRPGYDAGTGWIQTVEMTFAGGAVERLPTELPCELDDGRVSGDTVQEYMIALPTCIAGAVRFEARGLYGDELIVRGDGLSVTEIGEARYVEEFPGTNP